MSMLDLDKLANYLDGESNEVGLDFAATHGFLCATVVGPALAKWRTHLFDGEENKVPKDILEQVELWRASILNDLANDEEVGFPVEIEEATVDSSLGDWCIGFIDALFLNEENDWFDIDEEAVGMLTLPMIVFSGIDEDDAHMKSLRADADLLEDMAEEIMENVSKLYLLFHAPEA